MKIAVLGAGNVGTTLGKRFVEVGHSVVFGVRDPQAERYRQRAEEAGGSVATVHEAAQGAAAVLLAVGGEVAVDVVREAGDLTDKVLLDATNPLGPSPSGDWEWFTDAGGSLSEQIAEAAPGAHVFKVFATVGVEVMKDPVYDGRRAFLPVAGDDPENKPMVLELAKSLGFEAVDAGPLHNARLLEFSAYLWIQLAGGGLGRDFAFGLLRR